MLPLTVLSLVTTGFCPCEAVGRLHSEYISRSGAYIYSSMIDIQVGKLPSSFESACSSKKTLNSCPLEQVNGFK